MPIETAQDVGLKAENKMLRLMKTVIDKTLMEMEDRFNELKEMGSTLALFFRRKETNDHN